MIRLLVVLPVALIAACASPPPAAPPAPGPAISRSHTGSGAPAESSTPIPAAELAETARASVRASTVWVARGVDSWFGDRPFGEGGQVTKGQLDISLLKREGESLDADVRLNARFRLPNIDRLGYLFVGRDNERELVTDRPGALTRQDQLQATPAQDKKFFVGLGRALDEVFDARLGVRGAFKLYAQARARWQWQLNDDNAFEFRETLFWTVDDRFGSTTAVAFDHRVTPSLGVQWLAAATITQDLPKFVWASSVGAYQSFGDQRVLGLEALINGQQSSGVGALDYGLQARWEQPVYEDWLLGGVIVGHFWPRPLAQAPRRSAWALGASLKMRF